MIGIKYIRRAFKSFYDLRIAYKTFGVMLIPVISFILIFEVFIPKTEIIKQINKVYPFSDIVEWKIYIIYLSVAIAHLIISSIVILYLRSRFISYYSQEKSSIFLKVSGVLLLFLLFLFMLANIFDINIALLSNERILSILQEFQFYEPYFNNILGFYSFQGITLFSIIPFTLILFGLVVIVLTCINIGFDLSYVINKIKTKPNKKERDKLSIRIKSFNNYLYILSSVLFTSTIATILYLQLPLTCLKGGKFFESFKEQSFGLGICWGIIFSLTMLSMCLYPFYTIKKETKLYVKESEVIEDAEYVQWLQNLGGDYLIYKNIKSLASVMTPIIVSVIPKFL